MYGAGVSGVGGVARCDCIGVVCGACAVAVAPWLLPYVVLQRLVVTCVSLLRAVVSTYRCPRYRAIHYSPTLPPSQRTVMCPQSLALETSLHTSGGLTTQAVPVTIGASAGTVADVVIVRGGAVSVVSTVGVTNCVVVFVFFCGWGWGGARYHAVGFA